MEPKLVAATAHMDKYVTIHSTCEHLPDGLFGNSKGFLLNKRIVQVQLDGSKVKNEMDYYQKRVVIAYFVGMK